MSTFNTKFPSIPKINYFPILISLSFIYKAAVPATSGIEAFLQVITGQPQAIASKIGSPKPS